MGGFTVRKKFRAKWLGGRVDDLAAAQNARISADRFAATGAFRHRCERGAASLRARRNKFLACRERAPVVSRANSATASNRCAQSPIRFLRSALTACGLALPPDAFITWPTN